MHEDVKSSESPKNLEVLKWKAAELVVHLPLTCVSIFPQEANPKMNTIRMDASFMFAIILVVYGDTQTFELVCFEVYLRLHLW